MKQLLTTLALVIATSMAGQSYSTYYGTYDVNQNVNVNKKVNVSGTVNQNIKKTITTIDYGALAAANAQKEANRLNAMKYEDSRDAARASQIAADPFAAFTYGTKVAYNFSRSESRKKFESFGHAGKKLHWSFTQPNALLFSHTGGLAYRNTSADGVVLCELEIGYVSNYDYRTRVDPENYPASVESAREYSDHISRYNIEGEVQIMDGEEYFTHKSELARATVYGIKGYLNTWIYETEFEYVIKDNYVSMSNGILYHCGIRYTVDKLRGTFEDLEGRRYYLRRLGEEIIATAKFYYL